VVAEQRAQGEVRGPAARRHHRTLRHADHVVVGDAAAVGVEHAPGLEQHGVLPALRVGELYPVAGLEWAAHGALSTRARSAVRSTPTTSSPETIRYVGAGLACTARMTSSPDRSAARRRCGSRVRETDSTGTHGRRFSGTAAAACS